MASLQEVVRDKIFKDVIDPHQSQKETKRNDNSGSSGAKESQWKVLVLDQLATKMVSACCKMHEIMAKGITLVEDLSKMREPLPQLDAIYLITPTEESVQLMLSDFAEHGKWTYKAAHIYFTEACPDELFTRLCKHPATKYKAIKTLKEVNIAFVPYESRVFSLDSRKSFSTFYCPDRALNRVYNLERIAEQIATVCSALGEYPSIRYRSFFDKNHEFAQLVQQKLVAYKADDPSMGDGPQKDRSQLIILDRGFDPVSPVLHELTFQAMAYDLLDIKDDVFHYRSQSAVGEKEKEAILDESDQLWVEMRHQHIATVSTSVTTRLKKFAEDKRIGGAGAEKSSVKDVAQMVKKMPQYQKELNNYGTHMHLAEDCMTEYQAKVSKLCKVEQDLAMGTDAVGERIKDPMRSIVPVLLDSNVLSDEKIRVMILYILFKGGLSDENLTKLIQHANIPPEDKVKLFNLQYLGVSVVQDNSGNVADVFRSTVVNPSESSPLLKLKGVFNDGYTQLSGDKESEISLPKSLSTASIRLVVSEKVCGKGNKRRQYTGYQAMNRKERISEHTFQQSRWTPFIKDLMEDACDDKLDQKQYPYLSGAARRGTAAPVSARARYNWSKGQSQPRSGPRLIIFVIGGITLSETRAAYEVSTALDSQSWDVHVGSTHIITPSDYLVDLASLTAPPAEVNVEN